MARPNQQTVNDLCFNLLIVGDGGAGKTTLLKSHLTGESGMTYEPIFDADGYPLDFFTNRGKIRFYCWETAGHVPVPRLYGDCAIIMFDVTARRPTHLPSWLGKLFRSCAKEIPVVLCGNKIDLGRQMSAELTFAFARKKNLQFCEISAKSNHNTEKPFLYLARKLAGDANLHFVESPALAPPEVQFVAQAQVEAELVLLNMNDDNTFE